MCAHGKFDGVGVEILRSCRTANALTVLATRVFSDDAFPPRRAFCIALADFPRKSFNVVTIGSLLAFSSSARSIRSGRRIFRTCCFSRVKCGWLDQEALSLVTLSRCAPLQDNGPKT